ncbi:MAG: restriction endonuclease subunit S [Anaerolineaceae bacterium]|nr:restriction endonuclease subunit S [Anaerolineaceae bacterium]
MTNNWKKVRLGDLGRIVTGRTPPTSCPGYFGDKYPFITPTDMNGRKKASSTERYLSIEGARLLKNNLIPPKSIAVSCIGWQMGKSILTTQPSFTNQQLNTIIPKEDIDSDFLYYMLLTKRDELFKLGAMTGVRTPILNKSAFSDFQVTIPSKSIQQKISSILSAYDDLIENNTRRIHILEEMAQVIYREWFVKFRFPGYEGVRMVGSSLGKIPIGWEVSCLKSILNNIRDNVSPGDHLNDQYYVPIDCLPRLELALENTLPGLEAKSSLILFKRDDILFGAMRAYFHKVVVAPFDGVTRSTCFVLRPRESYLSSFSIMTVFDNRTIDYASNHSRGATMPYAVWDGSLNDMPILIPEKKLLIKFNDYVRPLITRIQSNFFIQRNLRRQRDLLLPRLLNGDLYVEG